MPEEMIPGTSIEQAAARASSFVNTKYGADVMNLSLGNLASFQQAMQNELVRMGQVSGAISGATADRFINNTPTETAGEIKMQYANPPTGFTGVGHYPAEPATGG